VKVSFHSDPRAFGFETTDGSNTVLSNICLLDLTSVSSLENKSQSLNVSICIGISKKYNKIKNIIWIVF